MTPTPELPYELPYDDPADYGDVGSHGDAPSPKLKDGLRNAHTFVRRLRDKVSGARRNRRQPTINEREKVMRYAIIECGSVADARAAFERAAATLGEGWDIRRTEP